MFNDVQREKMKFDRERLALEQEKVELERQYNVASLELDQTVTLCGFDLEKERLRLVRETEEWRIMLQDINLLDEEGKKWLLRMKKRINEREN